MLSKGHHTHGVNYSETKNRSIETVDKRAERIDFIVRDIDRLYDRVTALGSPSSEPVRSLLAAAGTILREDLNHLSDTTPPTLTPTAREILNNALTELGIELKE